MKNEKEKREEKISDPDYHYGRYNLQQFAEGGN